jgi:hypothetical protein
VVGDLGGFRRRDFVTRFGEISRPQLPVERAVLNRFRDVLAGDGFDTGQIRDGPSDL